MKMNKSVGVPSALSRAAGKVASEKRHYGQISPENARELATQIAGAITKAMRDVPGPLSEDQVDTIFDALRAASVR